MRKLLSGLCLLAVWIFLIALIFYFTVPLGNIQADHYDVLLVLGYPTSKNGSPRPEQRQRVLEAVRQYHAGVAPRIILAGGAAHNRFVEADAMAAMAKANGVPAGAILEDRSSQNTVENIENATEIMHTHGWNSVEAITSPAHARRASFILMHAPFSVNWRMQEAPWPSEYNLLTIASRYLYEILDCTRIRILGLHESVPSRNFHISPVK